MRIKFWPDLVDWETEVYVKGDIMTIDGVDIDFSVIKEGFRLPGSALDNKLFVESAFIERRDGVLHMTVRLPVSWDSPEEYRNPTSSIFVDITDGKLMFPDTKPKLLIDETPPIEDLQIDELVVEENEND